jgi:hypothetical protein
VSSLTWIDFDEVERQRSQRIMALFRERETPIRLPAMELQLLAQTRPQRQVGRTSVCGSENGDLLPRKPWSRRANL